MTNTEIQTPKPDLWDAKTSRFAHKIRAAFSQWCMFCMQCAEGTVVKAIDRRDPTVMKILIERDWTELVRYHHLKDVYLPDCGIVSAAILMAQDAYFDRPVREVCY